MDELKIVFRKLNSKPIVVQPLYIDLAGSVTAGMMLSQIVYWWYAMDEKPFWKTNEDWQKELRMGRDEFLAAKKTVRRLKFIKTEVRGSPPRTFFSVDTEMLVTELIALSEQEFSIVGKPNNQLSENAETEEINSRETQQSIVGKPDNSYTESTEENGERELGSEADAPETHPVPSEPSLSDSTASSETVGMSRREALRSALDKLLDCGDLLDTLSPKHQAQVVLGFFDKVATHKKLTNGGVVKMTESILNAFERGVDAEEMIHAMWKLQHCTFAVDKKQWKTGWDLYYLLDRKKQDKIDVAYNRYDADTETSDDAWDTVQPFQKLLTTPLKRYVKPQPQAASGQKDYSALARKPA